MLFYPEKKNKTLRNDENLIWKILQAFQNIKNHKLWAESIEKIIKICYLENFSPQHNLKLTTNISLKIERYLLGNSH